MLKCGKAKLMQLPGYSAVLVTLPLVTDTGTPVALADEASRDVAGHLCV